MTNNIPSGVSIESASYMENNNLVDNDNLYASENSVDESAPKLFSEDQNYQDDTSVEINDQNDNDTEQLFDQDIDAEEDFEIPAFLRKQKF